MSPSSVQTNVGIWRFAVASDCPLRVRTRRKRLRHRGPLLRRSSDFRLLGQCQSILNLDPQIADRAFPPGMVEQKLDGPQSTGSPIDQGHFHPPHGMGPIGRELQTDLISPAIDQTGILTRRNRSARSHMARKQVVAAAGVPPPNPLAVRLPGLLGNLELDRKARLLLDHGRTGVHRAVQRDIAMLEADKITATQLAVDGQIELRQVVVCIL